ncbi:MAG: hypothetical protein PHH40_00475 [Candidatus Moranbacteria bacterium]|nr:hypothetical protein [Candidatus Moranbacteria bacterium]MDD3964787.1 hypothetical protein [Candidatus Moranbacteria bacterium]
MQVFCEVVKKEQYSWKKHVVWFLTFSKSYLEKDMTIQNKEKKMIEDVIKQAEKAIERRDLVVALAARKVFVYITREERYRDHEYFTAKYREICAGIDKLIYADEALGESKTTKRLVA